MDIKRIPLVGAEPLVYLSEASSYYLVELNHGLENRYNEEFTRANIHTLNFLRTQLSDSPKPLITTSRTPKFFSNGIDLETALSNSRFIPDVYLALMRAYLDFPWPTIALVNGHAYAGGLIVAACHDYRVMNPKKGYLCLNEVLINVRIPAVFLSLFRVKFGAHTAKQLALRGLQFTSQEALRINLIDGEGGIEEAAALAQKLAPLSRLSAYPHIRRDLLRDVYHAVLSHDEAEEQFLAWVRLDDARLAEARKTIQARL